MHAVVRRLVAVAVLTCVASVALASSAGAEATTDAWVSDGEIGAGASNTGRTPGSGGGGGGRPRVACTYTPLDEKTSGIADGLAEKGWSADGPAPAEGGASRPGDGEGTWYRKSCPSGSATVLWVPVGGGVSPRVLAEDALDLATIPLPAAQINPPPGSDQIVNVPSWLWVENFLAVTATASVGAVSVTVTARPVRVDWAMGNGDKVTCNDGGVAYDASRSPNEQHTTCSYTYRSSSAVRPSGMFSIRATAVWHVTWVASGVNATGDLGLINRSTDIAVRVAEIQTVNQ